MLTQEILEIWKNCPSGHVTQINSLCNAGFQTWAVKPDGEFGVAILLPEGVEVYESFAEATLINGNANIPGFEGHNMLILRSRNEQTMLPFAALCAELVMPGVDGVFRKEVEQNPVGWWLQWKELLGNKNIDLRVYDVLGELYVLRYLLNKNFNAVWNGPSGATYDIDCDDFFCEVKSSTSRSKKQITLSNQFQLVPPDNKKLSLMFCQFEPAQSGLTINGLVDDLVSLGYSRQDLEENLTKLGLEKRKSVRDRGYVIHCVTKYDIDDKFPAIRPSSFVDGRIPVGIEGITYTLSLDGLEGEVIEPVSV